MNPSHQFFVFAPQQGKFSVRGRAPDAGRNGTRISEKTGDAAKDLWGSLRAVDPLLPLRPPSISISFVQYLDELRRETDARTALLVQTLCFKYSWVCVKGFAEALQHFVGTGQDHPLTPMIFRQLMRNHILPEFSRALLPERLYAARCLSSFLLRNDVGWNSLWNAGIQFVDSSDPYDVSIGQLMMLAETINTHLGWNNQREVEPFCEFCWRFKLRSGKYCAVHSTKRVEQKVQHAEDNALWGWVRDGDYYMYSHSLREAFESKLHQIMRADTRQKAKSSWHAALAEGYLHGWLAQYRRTVYMAIGHALGEPGDAIESELEKLIQVLDIVAGESPMQMERRSDFHRALALDRVAIFKMLQRAEAWLSAAQTRRKKWGGTKVVKLRDN